MLKIYTDKRVDWLNNVQVTLWTVKCGENESEEKAFGFVKLLLLRVWQMKCGGPRCAVSTQLLSCSTWANASDFSTHELFVSTDIHDKDIRPTTLDYL